MLFLCVNRLMLSDNSRVFESEMFGALFANL